MSRKTAGIALVVCIALLLVLFLVSRGKQPSVQTIIMTQSSSSISQSSASTSSVESVPYEVKNEIRIGDTYGQMTVTGRDAKSISFSGKATIEGDVRDFRAEEGRWPICMYNFTPESAAQLPFFDADDINDSIVREGKPGDYIETICFDDAESLTKGFTRGTKGKAKVAIADYTLDVLLLEGTSNWAKIVQVLEFTPE